MSAHDTKLSSLLQQNKYEGINSNVIHVLEASYSTQELSQTLAAMFKQNGYFVNLISFGEITNKNHVEINGFINAIEVLVLVITDFAEDEAVLHAEKFLNLFAGQIKASSSFNNKKLVIWNPNLSKDRLTNVLRKWFTSIQTNLSDNILYITTFNPILFIEQIKYFLSRNKLFVDTFQFKYDAVFAYHLEEEVAAKRNFSNLESNNLLFCKVNYEFLLDFSLDSIKPLLEAKLLVIYFFQKKSWAISFIKELWKVIKPLQIKQSFILLQDSEVKNERFINIKSNEIQFYTSDSLQLPVKLQEWLDQYSSATVPSSKFQFCPYTGLRPFNEEDSLFFCGRERQIEIVSKQLLKNNFVCITGSSGDGKSSLVYAGLIPFLKSGLMQEHLGDWLISTFKPERKPLTNLAKSLSRLIQKTSYHTIEEELKYGFSALVNWYKKNFEIDSGKYAKLLIIVDQFEEFFNINENFDDGHPTSNAVLTINILTQTVFLAQQNNLPIYLVFTLRSDYIGSCSAFLDLAELVGKSIFFVPRLTREEVHKVIQLPALLNGNSISHRLTQRLLNDLSEGIDQLPVLQHALHQIWHFAGCGQETMDLIHYAKAGGISYIELPEELQIEFLDWYEKLEAAKQKFYEKPSLKNILNKHADELFYSAHEYYFERYNQTITPDDAQYIIKCTFIGLTRLDENKVVRNRMTLQEITALINRPHLTSQIVGRVLNAFRDPGASLIQPYISDIPGSDILEPNAMLDISHESLIRNWSRLQDWINEEKNNIKIFNDFLLLLNRWLINDKSKHYLLNKGLFLYFESWFNSLRPNIAWIKRHLFKYELVFKDQGTHKAAEDYLKEMKAFLIRSKNKLDKGKNYARIALVSIFLLLLISIYLYIETVDKAQVVQQRNISLNRQKKELVENQRLIQKNAYLSAEKERLLFEQEKLLSLQKIQEEERKRKEALGLAEKSEEIARRERIEKELAHNKAAIALKERQILENQKYLADLKLSQESEKAKIALERTKEANEQRSLAEQRRDKALIIESSYLAAKAQALVQQKDYEIALLLSLKALPNNLLKPSRPYVPEAEAALYNAASNIVNANPTLKIKAHKNKITSVNYSPDGNYIITTSWDRTAKIWNTRTGKLYKELNHSNVVVQGEFSNDGRYIITISDDFSITLWDAISFNYLSSVGKHKGVITTASLISHENRIITCGNDKLIKIWDINSFKLINQIAQLQHPVKKLALSHDKKLFATCSNDYKILIVEVSSGNVIRELSGFQSPCEMIQFLPNQSNYLISVTADKIIRIWNTNTGQMISASAPHRAALSSLTISSDAKQLITTDWNGVAAFFELEPTLTFIRPINQPSSKFNNAVFANNNSLILFADLINGVQIWDKEELHRLTIMPSKLSSPFTIAINPDSKSFVLANDQFEILVFKILPENQQLIDFAYQNLKNRDLTSEEINTYLIK